MRKTILLTAAGVTLAGGLVYGAAHTYAQAPETQSSNIIQKLVQRFGLQESDVKAVFDEVHTERQTQMKQKAEERLTQLVTEGTLTEAQKQAILTKTAELQSNREAERDSFKDLTPEERRTVMEQKKAELQTWAAENNIDVSLLPMFGHGAGMHRGMKWEAK